jgi:hypothetical protein
MQVRVPSTPLRFLEKKRSFRDPRQGVPPACHDRAARGTREGPAVGEGRARRSLLGPPRPRGCTEASWHSRGGRVGENGTDLRTQLLTVIGQARGRRGSVARASARDPRSRTCTRRFRAAAEAMTIASTTVAPATAASASPALFARRSVIASTSTSLRIFAWSRAPRHHSATTTAGIEMSNERLRAATSKAIARGFARSRPIRKPVSPVTALIRL